MEVLVWLRQGEQKKRQSKGLCVMCGKPLGFLDRLRKETTQRRKCTSYK